ncbi:MAG: CPBP family intramembrane metalloprotease, partial [Phycisphaerales bacterium]|nr:CPBP family intramembrane metalloprotease [Phycisphaerales bacterium]
MGSTASWILTIVLCVIGLVFIALAIWKDWLRPGSFRRAIAADAADRAMGDVSARPRVRPLERVSALHAIIFATTVFLFGGIATALAMPVPEMFGVREGTPAHLATLLGMTYAVTAPAALAMVFGFKLLARTVHAGSSPTDRAPELDWLNLRASDVWTGLALAVPTIGVCILIGTAITAIAAAVGGPAPDQLAHTVLRQTMSAGFGWPIIVIAIAAAIGAPIVEEVMVRGFLQSGIRAASGSPWLAIGVSSVLFTMMHIGSVNTHALP